MIIVSPEIRLFEHELVFTFARSSGKGGQNVNKVSSKAQLRWNPRFAAGIPADVLERFLKKYGSQLNVDGEVMIQSERTRSQNMNVDDCIEKLKIMLLSVARAPKTRKKTKVSKTQKKKRLESKRIDSEKKQSRQKVRRSFW